MKKRSLFYLLIRERRYKMCCLVATMLCWGIAHSQAGHSKPGTRDANLYSAYLFAYFTGNDKKDEAIRFALSSDGYHFAALNGNNPVINSTTISSTGGVRDPHIIRGADGKTFYMVATDMVSALGWSSNRAMVLLKSTDLVSWTSAVVNIQKKYPGQEELLRVWAPQTIYDSKAGKYMIYWSMKYGKDPDKIFYAYANRDFTDLETEPKQLFFSPVNGACIDGDIIKKDGKYYLFFKTEGNGSGIKTAVSDKLTEGYTLIDRYVQQTADPVEGSGIFKLNNGEGYILMYDLYTKGRYQFTKSKDLEHFTVVDNEVSMNFHPRHGTVMPLTTAEAERLSAKWLTPPGIIATAENSATRKKNSMLDTASGKLFLSGKPGINLAAVDVHFTALPGVTIKPSGKQDFSKGPVNYTVSVKGGASQTYNINIRENHNPVLDGYYADPDILYSEQTKKFYIYPTSDGFTGWSGTYFKTFSSPDMITWKDEGVILDLQKDVSWAKKNAWAPCIIEKKTGAGYKYYYYFTAAQKIGVAVADKPTGPFVDAGSALIDKFPEGITRGQQIDPDVFMDPQSGKTYLYWGNGYMAGALLSDSMTTIVPGSLKLLTPIRNFREGTYVFYRKGRYYFMWSEDDTRSENYRVAYGMSDSALGKIQVPEKNIILKKDPSRGIYGTGHNSVIQIPGKDEWYIVYHRFSYPEGIKMGSAAGYNREICIDKMEFNEDGTIKEVVPTIEGIRREASR